MESEALDQRLVMPEKFMELSENEMEYDGGLLNFVAAAACTVAGLACTIASYAVPEYKKELTVASLIFAGAGAVLSFGTMTTVIAGGTAALNDTMVAANFLYSGSIGVMDLSITFASLFGKK